MSGKSKIRSHRDLDAYRMAYEVAMDIFNVSKGFPKEETYSLTDQIRRSSRSVCANLAEAFRKRKYVKSFIAKVTDAEAEAAETQNWLDFAKDCGYINQNTYTDFNERYDMIIGKLVNMVRTADKWKV